MVVSSTSIEVNVYLAVTDGLDELVLVKIREFKHVVIQEELFTLLAFSLMLNISTNIKTVLKEIRDRTYIIL